MFKGFRIGRCTTDYPPKPNYRNDNNDIIVLLSTELHSTRRADRIKHTMFKHYQGIKYIHADIENNKLLIIGEVDPKHLRQGFEDLNDQTAEFVSAHFVKEAARLHAAFVAISTEKRKVEAAANKKLQPQTKPENVEATTCMKPEQKKEDSKPIENLQKTIILKMNRNCNCDGCVEHAKKTISKCNGVDSVAINDSKNLVTIKGTRGADDLIRHLQTKLKSFSFEVVSPENEKADGKSSNGRVDEKDEEESKKKVEDGNDHIKNVEDHKMEQVLPSLSPTPQDGWYYQTEPPHGFRPGDEYAPGPHYANYGYVMEPGSPPTPPPVHQMFSDDNPNACSIM